MVALLVVSSLCGYYRLNGHVRCSEHHMILTSNNIDDVIKRLFSCLFIVHHSLLP